MKKKPATLNESQIGNLLERHRKNLKPPQSTIERLSASVIKEVTGFSIKPEQVSYAVSTRTITLKVPSIVRSELKQHYKKILTELKKQTSEETVPKTIL